MLTHAPLKNTSTRDEFSKVNQFALNNHSFHLLFAGHVLEVLPHQEIKIVRSFSQISNVKILERKCHEKTLKQNLKK